MDECDTNDPYTPVRQDFSTFIGIDLGGARGKTTAVARLTRDHGDSLASVEEVSTRHDGSEPWSDATLIDYLAQFDGHTTVIAIDAPLTIPACLRCQESVCPGKERCVDPAVIWLRQQGVEMVAAASSNDIDRVAVSSDNRVGGHRVSALELAASRSRPRLEPYMHRCTEVVLCYERGVVPRNALGLATGPIAARAAHLRRLLASRGYTLHENLLEVSPHATVRALFGARLARGYKRDADPWQTRAAIIEGLTDMGFSLRSRLSREDVLRNDHCFEALISGYTAYLWARDSWSMPDGVFDADGWIWAPSRSH